MRWAALLAMLSVPGLAASVSQWRLTRSEHFEVYAQSSDQRACALLTWLEQLRTFFEQPGGSNRASPVRAIVFGAEREYEPYRLRENAAAYYVGGKSQDYNVIGTDEPEGFSLAAH